MDKIWYLKRINIFEDAGDSCLQRIDKYAIHKYLKKKEPIYLPGDKSDKVYLLKEGRVKVSKLSEDGREMTLEILEPGEIFGESAIFNDDDRRTTMAEALDDAMVCIMYQNEFEEILKRQPDLAMKFTREIGSKSREMESKLEDMVFRNVPARLAHLLLKLEKKHGKKLPSGIKLDVTLTHLEIANLIGSTRETTTTTLNNLKDEGLINVKNRNIYITDKEGLRELAGVYE